MNKKLFVPLIALGILAIVSTAYVGMASAKENTGQTMSERLAQKLGLDHGKVQTAFDEIRKENKTERQAQISTKLDQAIKDGVITNEQKEKLLNKMSEMKEERSQTRGQMRQWAEDNGIDFSKLKNYGFGNHKFGNRFGSK